MDVDETDGEGTDREDKKEGQRDNNVNKEQDNVEEDEHQEDNDGQKKDENDGPKKVENDGPKKDENDGQKKNDNDGQKDKSIEQILIKEGEEFSSLFKSRLESIHEILSSSAFSIDNIYESKLWESKPQPDVCLGETTTNKPMQFVRTLFPIAFSNRKMVRDPVQAVGPNPSHRLIASNPQMDEMEHNLFRRIVVLAEDIGRIRRYAELQKSRGGSGTNEKFFRTTINNLNLMEELVNNEVDKWCTTHLLRTDLIHRTHNDIDDSVTALKMYDLKTMLNLKSTAGRLIDIYIDLNDIAQSIHNEDNFANSLFKHLYT